MSWVGTRVSVPAGARARFSIRSSSSASRLPIAIARAVGGGRIDDARGDTGDDRDAVPGGDDRERIRPDRCGDVAVRGDPIGRDEDRVDLARGDQRRRGGVGDEQVRDAGRGQLPAADPAAGEARPALRDDDPDRDRRAGGRSSRS